MEDQAPGTRKGSRRAARPARSLDRRTAALGAGTLAAGVAWAALVYAGIRFGQSARDGDDAAWLFLVVATLGAVACLFLAMMLGLQVARALGVAPRSGSTKAPKGGRRAAGKRAAPHA